MRHADIRTIYGDAMTPDMREASGKIALLALTGDVARGLDMRPKTDCKMIANTSRKPLSPLEMVGAIGFEPMTSTV